MARVTIGIDLGATNLKGGIVTREGKVLGARSVAAHVDRGPETVVEEMSRLVSTLLETAGIDRSELLGIGVGSPGPLSPRDGVVYSSSNMKGWSDVPLVEMLGRALDVPVALDNDANVAAFGEAWVGAGRGTTNLVMLTLGTGIGGGVILDDELLHGHFENAGELGHMIVVPDGLPCPCGQRGCLERYASAGAVARRVVSAIQDGGQSALRPSVEAGEEVNSERVVACARDGDALCLEVFDDACRILAVACITLQHAFNPAVIALGGGMAAAGDFLLERVEGAFRERQWHLHSDYPRIVLAQLGNDAGFIGAARLAWRRA